MNEVLSLAQRGNGIFEILEDENPELAEEVAGLTGFADLIHLTDRDVQKVMREVDCWDLAKALCGMDDEFRGKIFGNISKRAVAMLKDDMERAEPIEPDAVEEARQKIFSIFTHLEETGEVFAARYGSGRIVAQA